MWIFSMIWLLLFWLRLISKNASYFACSTECCDLHSSVSIGLCYMSDTNQEFRSPVQSFIKAQLSLQALSLCHDCLVFVHFKGKYC